MPTKNWDGSAADGLWMTPANWEEAAIPVHGDDVRFEGAKLVGTHCDTGPTAVVLLNSIMCDAAYAAAIQVCSYANCGMSGARMSSVVLAGKGQASGGWGDTIYLNGNDADCRTTGGDWTTANIAAAGRLVGGTVGTANFNGDGGRHYAPTTSTTVNLNGDECRTNSGTIGTLNVYGDDCMHTVATVTMAHVYGENFQVAQWTITGTLNLHGKVSQVSLTAVAQGDISNGPYLHGRNQILKDYDTSEEYVDCSLIPANEEGKW